MFLIKSLFLNKSPAGACRTAEQVRAAGYTVSREPAPVPGIGTRVTKVQDPDGWTLAFVDNGDFLQELCKADLLQGPACDAPPPPAA